MKGAKIQCIQSITFQQEALLKNIACITLQKRNTALSRYSQVKQARAFIARYIISHFTKKHKERK
jgi:hypothetical protein